jgi:hypothetical protein
LPTVVSLIELDLTIEHPVVLFEQGANLVEHAPRGLVGDAQLSLQLLCGYPASSARHEIDAVEPQFQGRSRSLEDRALQGVLVVATVSAGIRGSVLLSVVLRDLLALGAVDALRVQLADQVVEARGVVGELLVELEDRVSGLRSGASAGVVSVDL